MTIPALDNTDSGIAFRSDMKVSYVQHMGSDLVFAEAARQSTQLDLSMLSYYAVVDRDKKLIGKLIAQRHTSPFEHSALTVAVECPLFVSREWQRHRTQSYSEMSLRYTTSLPEFWVPGIDHGIENVGTRLKPKRGTIIESRDNAFRHEAEEAIRVSYSLAWRYYQEQIQSGVAEEVARTVLPLGTYTRMWATANLVNWLKFLSLRTHEETASVVSYPQREIEQAARQVEDIVAEFYPVTHDAWNEAGRVL